LLRFAAGYGFCFDGSFESADGAELAPAPLDGWSVEDELQLEDDGEDGAGVAGLAGVDGVRLIEPEPEAEPDGEDGDVELLPEVAPLPAGRSAPRSHAAIRLAPRARETATARV
jgi:hypothetical protein